MAASNSTDDFFGVGMAGANPSAQRYAPVHQMAQQTAQTQATQYKATQQNQPQVQANMPAGWNNMFQGGQLNAPRASQMSYTPSGNMPSQQQVQGVFGNNPMTPTSLQNALPQLNNMGIHVQNEVRGDLRPRMLMPDGTTIDLGSWGSTAQWQDRGNIGDWHTAGANAAMGAPQVGETVPRVPNGGANADSIPQDLATLREFLQNQYLGMLNMGGRYDPSFSKEDMTVPLDPSWGRLNDAMYNQLGLSNDATGRGLGMMSGMFNQGPVQADISRWQDMAGSAGNAMMGMWNSGGNFNPEYQDMIRNGMGMSAMNRVASGPSAIDSYSRQRAQAGVGMQALQNQAMTGGRGDINPQLEAIRSQGMLGLQDQLAQIKEQYGQMGLGAGSDIANALGTGASRGIADIVRQQSELAYGADQAAQGRMLQAGGMEQGAWQNNMMGLGQMNLGTNEQAMNAGNMISNSFLGQGQLWNDAQNRALGSMQGMGGLIQAGQAGALGNAQLGQDWRNTQSGLAQAYTNNPYASNMGALTPGLGMYPNAAQQNAQSNADRWYQEQLRYAMGPPILGQASGYAGNYQNLNMMPPQQSGWMNVLGTVAGAAVGATSKPWMFSSRDMKEDIQPAEGFLTKLKSLPISTWRYKGDPVKHIGPMAQDFQATFGVGDGRTLHFGDMLSVIMGGLKEMAHASAN